MAQQQRVERQIELKCDADKFFNAWTQETNNILRMVPEKIIAIELHQGTHSHSVGAVKTWHYVLDGRQEYVRTKVAEIDVKSRSVCYGHLGGNIMSYYKTLKSKIQAIPKGKEEGCFVKWSFEYEKKITQSAPDADIFINFLLGCAKDMDAHLSTA